MFTAGALVFFESQIMLIIETIKSLLSTIKLHSHLQSGDLNRRPPVIRRDVVTSSLHVSRVVDCKQVYRV